MQVNEGAPADYMVIMGDYKASDRTAFFVGKGAEKEAVVCMQRYIENRGDKMVNAPVLYYYSGWHEIITLFAPLTKKHQASTASGLKARMRRIDDEDARLRSRIQRK